MKNLIRPCAMVLFVSVALVLCDSGSSYGAKISDYRYIMNTEYSSHQGVVTAISRTGDYLMVSGRKIWLVDVHYKGSEIITLAYDENGTQMDVRKLKAGDKVFVFGGGMKDHEIAAKDIFLLDRTLSDQAFRDFPGNKGLKTWKREIMPGL